MELFTKSITSTALVTILQSQLGVDPSTIMINVSGQTPSMAIFLFPYEGSLIRVFHHSNISLYSFEGSLLKFEVQESSQTRNVLEDLSNVMTCIVNSLGGIFNEFGDDESLIGIDSPGTSNSKFILEQLYLKGFKDEDIADVLEELEEGRELLRKSNA